jgi:cupin 2 domain-containing protein
MHRLALHTPDTGEETELLFEQPRVRIKRIVSSARPDDVVFDQDDDEWFIVLNGDAALEIEGEQVDLVAGDHLLIPAHARHHVVRTSHGTTWLAVHLQ